MWSVRILCNKEQSYALSVALESADALSSYELSDDDHWAIEAIYEEEPDIGEIRAAVAAMAQTCNLECPEVTCEKLPEIDWLSENQKSFPPITIAGFFIHGEHIKPEIPAGHHELLINAATAFGTGTHETTSGCLEAIKLVAQRAEIKKPLDLGCGTAILAMAAAKTFDCQVYAADNDPEAVEVSQANLIKNRLDHTVSAFISEGMQSEQMQKVAPFDLIIANILATPLHDMAKEITDNIENNDHLILSGILNTQAEYVKEPYLAMGMVMVDQFQRNDWTVLIMQKRAGDE